MEVLGLAPNAVWLAEPNPLWANLYAEEAICLNAALGTSLLGLEHYGSTSVPGLKAKPILDILAGIGTLSDGPLLAAPLAALGYDYAGADIVPGHHIFGKGRVRPHLLHAVEHNSVIWHEALRFRNALRTDPILASEHEALKVRLSELYAESRAEYTAAKAGFIQSVLDMTKKRPGG